MKSLTDRILWVTEFAYCEDIWWRGDGDTTQDRGGKLIFMVNCSDVFAWGTADCEEITEDNIDLFEQTYAECEKIFGKFDADYAGLLFCARVRKLRPQGAWYRAVLTEQKWIELFDAAGPPREVDILNPQSHPND